jgi:hypothetical protein
VEDEGVLTGGDDGRKPWHSDVELRRPKLAVKVYRHGSAKVMPGTKVKKLSESQCWFLGETALIDEKHC